MNEVDSTTDATEVKTYAGPIRYFVRKPMLDLRENNPELFGKVVGYTEMFIIPQGAIIKEPIMIGEEELVEIEWKVKSDK